MQLMRVGMYRWRKLTPDDQLSLLEWRKGMHRPWHSPHHIEFGRTWLVTSSCFEHRAVAGASNARLADFSSQLIATLEPVCEHIYAWVALPNHYHALVTAKAVMPVLQALGQLHGRTAFEWNRQDGQRGRKVWFGSVETRIKSEGHHWAALNYLHHNPVRHRYVARWQDWPFSSAADYLEAVGRQRAESVWNDYPVLDFGQGWDAPEL